MKIIASVVHLVSNSRRRLRELEMTILHTIHCTL